jgi:predicted DNA-binding protein with PD1-like motif
MQAKLIDSQDRVYAVIFDTSEDPMEGLERFAADQNLDASSFTAIGARDARDIAAYLATLK